MPTNKDLKRLVRRRMQKTGESYTTARAQIVKTRRTASVRNGAAASRTAAVARSTSSTAGVAATAVRRPKAAGAPLESLPPVEEFAKLAGMSDSAIQAKTGCDWKRWVGALDHVKAHTWPHRKIAEYVREKYKVADWWTQAVTVGYERIRGLREIGQRRGGGYEASKSRTFAVPVQSLFSAFAEAPKRARWLNGVALKVRKATPHRSVRIAWPDGSAVSVWLVAKGAGKSAAQVQHEKLPDRATADRMKRFWAERLEELSGFLEG